MSAFFRRLISLVALVVAVSASGATYDPELTWRTIVTEHFRIHFHQGEEQLAEEFSQMVEPVFDTMTEEMKWVPKGRTEVVLVDRTDSANGYASVAPYKQIVIYVTAPQENSTLSLYEDWNEGIFTHELTHILHMDTNHGIIRATRAVVGSIVSTNDLSPWWLVEGLATFQETRQSAGGRGRSPYVDMIKRTAVVEDDFPPLGNMDGLQPDPPGGNLRYLFGQDFIQYVADHQGADVWTRWVHLYGGHIPYLLPAKKAFGRRLVPMYFDWKAHLYEKYGALAQELRAEGIREGVRVSPDKKVSCAAPSYSPDGRKLVFSCYDLRTGSAIWMGDGDGKETDVLLQDRGAKNFTWRSDSEAFVYAGTHVVNRFNTWSDIYMYTLGKGTSVKSLTNGARARDPDFSPDGTHLMMVTNRVQNGQLETLTVDQRQTALTDVTDHTQFATPRYSPDGRVVAVSVWAEGRRDLWLYSPEGEPLRRLTADIANDRDPEWSADGQYLYFSSDRTGIPNIYAIDIETERLWQVTNVLTGAVAPTLRRDGAALAYAQYSANGWDVMVMELDRALWFDRGLLPAQMIHDTAIIDLTGIVDVPDLPPAEDDEATALTLAWDAAGKPTSERFGRLGTDPLPAGLQAPSESIDSFEQADVKNAFGEEIDNYPFTIKPRRYNPWPTLLPRYYLPYIQTTTAPPKAPFDFIPWGLQVSLSTGTADTLQHYAYYANINYRTDANFLGWGASFTLNRWLPVMSIGGSSRAVFYGSLPVSSNIDGVEEVVYSDTQHYWERRTEAFATVSYPFTAKSTIFANYTFTHRTERWALPEETYLPLIPIRGTTGKLSAGYRYSWSQPTAYAVTREDGRIFSVVGSVIHPWLGTLIKGDDGGKERVTQGQITAELREYIVNPWVPNHVLALRAAGGVAIGGTDFFGNYSLGGSVGDGAYYVTPDEFRMLRGYPFASDIGDMYWLTGAEYRFPIWRIDRGLGTIPVFLRVLSAAVFIDAGNAFTNPRVFTDAFDDSLVGVGAELRLSAALGWGAFLTGRFGYAVGLIGDNAIGPLDVRTLYFQLGSSF